MQSDHLVPSQSFITYQGVLLDYQYAVAKSLLSEIEVTSPVVITIVCCPSFQVEWAIRLHGRERKGFRLTSSVAREPIWPACKPALVQVTFNAVEIPDLLATATIDEFRRLARKCQQPAGPRIGVDGVTYHVACRMADHSSICGSTWSPAPGTEMDRMTELARTLFDTATSASNDFGAVETALAALVIAGG
jgi:hypothetical protein